MRKNEQSGNSEASGATKRPTTFGETQTLHRRLTQCCVAFPNHLLRWEFVHESLAHIVFKAREIKLSDMKNDGE